MSCCGSQRQAYAAQPPQRRLLNPASAPAAAAPAVASAAGGTPPAVACFQYRGSRALSVRNPANGHRYVFTGPGAVVRVDPADALWLTGFPWLDRVG